MTQQTLTTDRRTVLIFGCVASKRRTRKAVPILELYTSTLWRKRIAWCEAAGRQVDLVLSARGGLVPADTKRAHYDATLRELRADADATHRFRFVMARRLAEFARKHGALELELHAGADYARELAAAVAIAAERWGVDATIVRPLEGLSIGKQFVWYAEAAAKARTGWQRREAALEGKASWHNPATGWTVAHCGHPTAIWPYYAIDPAHPGRNVVSHNGLGFRSARDARQAVDRVLEGELEITNDNCGDATRRILVCADGSAVPAAPVSSTPGALFDLDGQAELPFAGAQLAIPLA